MSRRFIAVATVLLTFAGFCESASAQITPPRVLSATPNRIATLQEQLNNQLRATSQQQRAYIAFLVQQIRRGRLDPKLIVAIKQKAVARNRYFPFPFFERAIRFEAAKRNVILPPLQQFATARPTPGTIVR